MKKLTYKNKSIIVAGIILLLTLGISLIRIFLFPTQGFYYGGPGMLLLIPIIPFIWIVGIFPNNIGLATTIIYLLSTIFWLGVAYAMGAYLDKKKKK